MALRDKFPSEFKDGARCGFSRKYEGPREPGGYPKNFHSWPIERRNAWWAGWNKGYSDRERIEQERGAK
jgi:hypothetical protein